MSNFKLSAFADEYADSFEEQLSSLIRFGIRNIELRHLDQKNISLLSKDEAKEAKKKLDHFGINVSAIGSPLGKIKLDSLMKEHLEAARRIFAAANIFETGYVRIFSFYPPDGKNITDMKSRVLDSLEKLIVLAREQGITLCLENEAMIYGDIPSRCKELFDHFNGELKAVFDMGNYVLEGVDPYPDAYELLKEHIAYFHIKDALKEGAIVPAGKGDAKIKEILTSHREYSKEDFFVTLEPHLQTFSGLNALVGRAFKNPYQYADQKSAFTDAVKRFKELI